MSILYGGVGVWEGVDSRGRIIHITIPGVNLPIGVP